MHSLFPLNLVQTHLAAGAVTQLAAGKAEEESAVCLEARHELFSSKHTRDWKPKT